MYIIYNLIISSNFNKIVLSKIFSLKCKLTPSFGLKLNPIQNRLKKILFGLRALGKRRGGCGFPVVTTHNNFVIHS